MSTAKSSLLSIPGLRGPGQASPLSHLPSLAFLASSPPTGPDTAKSRNAAGRGIRNDVTSVCESFAVQWPLLRPYRCTFGTSPFLRIHCIDRPLQTLFMFVVWYHCLPFLNQPSMALWAATHRFGWNVIVSTSAIHLLAPQKADARCGLWASPKSLSGDLPRTPGIPGVRT
jgi:hypothetical protein